MTLKAPIHEHFVPLTACLDISDPVWKAWRVMKDNSVKQLPVAKEDRIVGIVSDRDIVQISGFNGGQSMPVKEAMSLNPLILSRETTVEEAIRSMLGKDQQHAVVTDSLGKVCGLFSWDMVFKFFLDLSSLSQFSNLQQKGGYCD